MMTMLDPRAETLLSITLGLLASGALLTLTASLTDHSAQATPAFARKQRLGCPVCHTAFPQLTDVGRAFLQSGYRMPAEHKGVETTGMDLGSGIIVDPLPGLAVRMVSVPVAYGAEDGGEAQLSSSPLSAAELVALGSNGDHWSYMAHIETEAEEGFSPMFMGLVEYRFSDALNGYAGYTSIFSRDLYNSLNPERRLDHNSHAAVDYVGSTGITLGGEAPQVGVNGRVGPLFWLALATPGAGVDEMDAADASGGAMEDVADPLDYAGRVAVELTHKISVGGLAYLGNTQDASTVRAGVDFNAQLGSSTLQAVGLYDSADQAILAEAGWNATLTAGPAWLVPLGRVDLTVVGGQAEVAPTAGLGVMQSAGRVSVELSQPISFSEGASSPQASLIVDAVF